MPTEVDAVASLAVNRRAIDRLRWAARAEGLDVSDNALGTCDVRGALAALLPAVKSAAGSSWSATTWSAFEREVLQSVEFETAAMAWRRAVWVPSLARRAVGESSLWGWLASGRGPADAIERRLLWEVLCSFDGHPTHPCAKTKISL